MGAVYRRLNGCIGIRSAKRGDARPQWGGIDARRDLERELGLGMYAVKFCGVCKAVNSKMKMCGKCKQRWFCSVRW